MIRRERFEREIEPGASESWPNPKIRRFNSMVATAQEPTELFEGGPPVHLQTALHLMRPGKPRVGRRALLAILIGWAPLAVLSIAPALIYGSHVADSLFSDFASYARCLIAAPLLILAEHDCCPRLGAAAHQFLAAGLIRDTDRARFDAAVVSTRQLLDSKVAEIVVVIITYAAILTLVRYLPAAEMPDWFISERVENSRLSMAGWWYSLISLPLLIVLLLGWFWRQLLWGRFLWRMSRLDLRLIPSHPDLAGGLRFLSSTLRGYRLLAFSLGAMVAGATANRVLHEGISTGFKYAAIVIVIAALIVAVFVGPLTVFVAKLRQTRKRGIFEYGALAGALGWQFEQRWINQRSGVDEGVLSVPDFSATTDLYGVVANVYEMKDVPFGFSNVGYLIVAAVLPFIAVALLILPLKVILKDLAKLLF